MLTIMMYLKWQDNAENFPRIVHMPPNDGFGTNTLLNLSGSNTRFAMTRNFATVNEDAAIPNRVTSGDDPLEFSELLLKLWKEGTLPPGATDTLSPWTSSTTPSFRRRCRSAFTTAPTRASGPLVQA